MLQGQLKEETHTIDPTLIAKIQGAVFKTLRPRSIMLHMEARKLYRLRQRKSEHVTEPKVPEAMKRDEGRQYQEWLDSLNELEDTPIDVVMDQVSLPPVVAC